MVTKTRELVPQRWVFLNLSVTRTNLIDTEGNEDRSRKHKGLPRMRPIAQHDIDATAEHFKNCRCEQHGLHADMTLDALIRMGAGCTEGTGWWSIGYVCPRLVMLRRMYGH